MQCFELEKMEQLLDKTKGTIYGQTMGDALGLGTDSLYRDDQMAEQEDKQSQQGLL